MENINPVQILNYGVIGLGFLLAFLAYKLLSKEQQLKEPRKNILKAVYVFMGFSIVLCLIGIGSESIKYYVPTETPYKSGISNDTTKASITLFNLEDFKTGSTGTTKEEAIIITQQPIVFEWRSGEVTFSLYRVGDKTMFHELKERSPFTLKRLDSDLYKLRFNSDGEHFDVFFRVEISP